MGYVTPIKGSKLGGNMNRIMVTDITGTKYYGYPKESTALSVTLKDTVVVRKGHKPMKVGECMVLRSEISKEIAYTMGQ